MPGSSYESLRAAGLELCRPRRTASPPLLGTALPAIGASFAVLHLAAVGTAVWAVQAGAIVLAALFARTLGAIAPGRRRTVVAAGCLWLVALLPLGGEIGPSRWLRVGTLSLYVAPVVVPAVLVLASAAMRAGAVRRVLALAGLWALGFVFALQPDLSQLLALTAGAVVVGLAGRPRLRVFLPCLLPFAGAGWLAASRPDSLTPVEHVELVFELAFERAPWAGIGVTVAALATVVLLAARLARIERALLAVPVYYAMLFAISLSGRTPAPLIGFGAGPWLGLGLMLGLVAVPTRAAAAADARGP